MSGAVSGPEVLLILQPLALPLQVVVEGLPLLRALSTAFKSTRPPKHGASGRARRTWIRFRIAWLSAVIRSNSRRLGTEAQRSEVRAPLESPLRIASLCAPSLLVQALVVQLLVVVHLRPEASGVSPARRDERSSGKGPPRGRHAPSGTGADRCACPAQTPSCWQTPSPAGRSPSAVKPTRTKRSANLAAARAHGGRAGRRTIMDIFSSSSRFSRSISMFRSVAKESRVKAVPLRER